MSKVLFKTSLGDIELTLNAEKAPKTVENFLSYVKSGHYNDTIFHRVIPGFMVQGGGFDEKMEQKPTQAQIKNEANNGLKNKIGSVAMARTNEPHSASAQFFINVKDNDFLNFSSESGNGWGYAVFGEVTAGMPTVEKIVAVKTGNNGFHQDVPVTPVKVISAEVVE